jgi:hypothetical protein
MEVCNTFILHGGRRHGEMRPYQHAASNMQEWRGQPALAPVRPTLQQRLTLVQNILHVATGKMRDPCKLLKRVSCGAYDMTLGGLPVSEQALEDERSSRL